MKPVEPPDPPPWGKRVKFEATDTQRNAGVGDIYAVRSSIRGGALDGQPCVTLLFEPEAGELEKLAQGGTLAVSLFATTMPPIAVEVLGVSVNAEEGEHE